MDRRIRCRVRRTRHHTIRLESIRVHVGGVHSGGRCGIDLYGCGCTGHLAICKLSRLL
jgi:hypothetical protein